MPKYYLGIDVGYAEAKMTTGLCLIILAEHTLRWVCMNTCTRESHRRIDLEDIVDDAGNLCGVGIDGPLAQGLRQVDRYRSADALLNQGNFKTYCGLTSTGSRNGKNLHRHATILARLVLKLQHDRILRLAAAAHCDSIHQSRIVEAFPTAFLAFLLPENKIPCNIQRGKRSDRYWEIAVERQYLHDLIERLAPCRRLDGDLGQITDHDHRAAFVCALTAMCVERNQYVSVGNPECGDIILPPCEVWGFSPDGQNRWPEPTLWGNVDKVRSGFRLHRDARVIRNGHQWMPKP